MGVAMKNMTTAVSACTMPCQVCAPLASLAGSVTQTPAVTNAAPMRPTATVATHPETRSAITRPRATAKASSTKPRATKLAIMIQPSNPRLSSLP